jgi:ABC-type bacteriocin/lantibiotic exporter with double-glycine peptidase domain
MVLAYFGVEHSLKELVDECGCMPGSGTDNDKLVRAVRGYGLCSHTREGAAIEHIAAGFHQHALIIVNYFNPVSHVGHFAVVSAVEPDHITLADPKNGANYTLTHETFNEHWHNSDGSITGWMTIIARPEYCIYRHGKQYI